MLNGSRNRISDHNRQIFRQLFFAESVRTLKEVDDYSGGDDETVSFVSEKNTDVYSVQFVIKTAAVEKTETVETASTDTQQLNFWQKLIQLFHKKN